MKSAEEAVKGASEQVLFCPEEKIKECRAEGQRAASFYAALRRVQNLQYEDLPEDMRFDDDQA